MNLFFLIDNIMNLYIQYPIGRENLEDRLERDQVAHLWGWIVSPTKANEDAKYST
jgi:hypothetical protein